MSLTRVTVDGDRVRFRHAELRAQRIADRDGWVRVALLATQALLLGGDAVELEVEVGPGARLEIVEVAGTVAYPGRGRPARWSVRARVAEAGSLRWLGQPFVVADGADVTRSTDLELAAAGALSLRETVVLGRTGEPGGRLRNRTTLRVEGRDRWREDQLLDAADLRTLPGLLGGHRVLDSRLVVGEPAPGCEPGLVRFGLYGGGTLDRWLGAEPAGSPLA